MSKTVHMGFPCSVCEMTAEENDSPHVYCDECSLVGCRECVEEHFFMEHGTDYQMDSETNQLVNEIELEDTDE